MSRANGQPRCWIGPSGTMISRELADACRRRLCLITGALFLIVVPTTAHLLFSWMGFNPTDDGFILAGSRRLLAGQIPYIDFILRRPPGSYVLHLVFVYFGGRYTFWTSRWFVWLQFACIAWSWTIIIETLLRVRFSWAQRFLLSLTSFALCSHSFPIMSWNSIDGLFFCSVGLALCVGGSQHMKILGYGLIGFAPVCRQNFLPMIPGCIIAMGDWRRIRFWVAAGVPGLLTGALLLVSGALPDAVLQIGSLGSQGEFLKLGVKKYVGQWSVPWAVLGGYWAMRLASGQMRTVALAKSTYLQRLVGALVLYGTPLAAAVALSEGRSRGVPSFYLFGTATGACMYFIAERGSSSRYVRAGILALLAAWSVSLSRGYNTPALAGGVLAVLLLSYGQVSYRSALGRRWAEKVPNSLALAVAVVAVIGFVIGRYEHIYREQPARDLTQPLDGVLPGGNLIRTNENTLAFLEGLGVAIHGTGGREYAILPDLAGYWVRSEQLNPIPIDWAQGAELDTPALLDRVIRDLDTHRGTRVVIVQKVAAASLAEGFVPLRDSDYYAVVRHVRRHFTKIGETEYFQLYE